MWKTLALKNCLLEKLCYLKKLIFFENWVTLKNLRYLKNCVLEKLRCFEKLRYFENCVTLKTLRWDALLIEKICVGVRYLFKNFYLKIICNWKFIL